MTTSVELNSSGQSATSSMQQQPELPEPEIAAGGPLFRAAAEPALPAAPQTRGLKSELDTVRRSTLELRPHGPFVDWLAATGGALAVTTYTSGKLAIFTVARRRLEVMVTKFARPLGLAVAGDRLAVVARENIVTYRRTDDEQTTRLAIEHAYTTGRLDAHDAAWGARGLYFVNTRYNCIARPSQRVRFLRTWQPRFVPGVVARDACHLNGLGMHGGAPRMATAFCQSDQPRGWKQEDRFAAGVVVDVRRNDVVVEGLCMPHSPRRYAGRWWLCNSGEGTLCTFDPRRSDWTEAAALPGFTRGLCFVGAVAVVGLSRIRAKHILDAPPVRDRCGRTIAGIGLVDLRSGRIVALLEFVKGGSEVYDVAFLPCVATVQTEPPDGDSSAPPSGV